MQDSTQTKPTVCLVIPARNSIRTIDACLTAVVAILEKGEIDRIIVVDDGSTDGTAEAIAQYPVTLIKAEHGGRSSARNHGWRSATEDIIWFVDSDCIAEPDAWIHLAPFFNDPSVGGAGGSYKLIENRSLLYQLIHEEIVQRHEKMSDRVNFLGTFNAAYRRSVLEEVDGFEPSQLRGQDADLSYRVIEAGYSLGFSARSRVSHDNYTTWYPYLRSQFQQGFWRIWLHKRHTTHATGDSYSNMTDHCQPPLAMLLVLMLPLLVLPLPTEARLIPILVFMLLVLAQIPMTFRLILRKKSPKFLVFGIMSFIRSFARGLGVVWAMLHYITGWRPPRPS